MRKFWNQNGWIKSKTKSREANDDAREEELVCLSHDQNLSLLQQTFLEGDSKKLFDKTTLIVALNINQSTPLTEFAPFF